MSSNLRASLLVAVAALSIDVSAAAAQATGPSGLPVPRFVSIKSDRVNVRQGPSRDHQVVWTFTRAGLPVEITAEFENWRRVRDAEGSEGWVQQALLSGRRTALVAPWRRGQTFDLRARAASGAEVRARVEAGVIATVRGCTSNWCRIVVENQGTRIDGFIEQASLWGVYPNEAVE